MKHQLHITRWLLLLVVLMTAQVVMAQRMISGVITDKQSGEALIGATVTVPGTNIGAVTDFEGKYAFKAPENATQVQVTYTGYASQVVNLGTDDVLNFQMEPGLDLKEVVVIGYGATRKEDLTGVVTAIKEAEFNRGAITSPDQLIAGKVAGVQILSNSGEPGGQVTVRVRGGTSVNAGNEPLYVVDGVPIENTPFNPGGFSNGRNPLNFLNPSDIETFTVLKDASATAIYGSRGANGVILITTKKGKSGSPGRITYDGYYTTARVVGAPSFLDPTAFRNVVTYKAPERLEQLGNTQTDWFDQTLQTATGQNHALSFMGGGEKTGYRVSLGYQDLNGVVRASRTQRTNFAFNLNQSLLDDQLLLNYNLKGSFTKDQFDPGVVGNSTSFDPTKPIYQAGSPYAGFFEYGVALSPRNPVSQIEQIEDFGKSFRGLGNIDAELKLDRLIDGLSAKTVLGFDVNNAQRERFTPTTFARAPMTDFNGELRNENAILTNVLLDFYLNYKRNFGARHRFDATAGYSYQDFRNEYNSFRAFNLSTDIFGSNSTIPAARFEANTSVEPNRLISFFARVNYNFDEKYLFTATVRRDGSSRFSKTNQYGTFPSAALAWRVSQENWAEGLNRIFSDLKVRVGWGITGNQAIGNFLYLPLYRLSDARARYQFGDIFVTTARPNGYDSNLKWEETTTYNAGIDFGFFNNRLSGSLEFYLKNTNDLLFTVNVPAGTNLTDRVLTNIGEVENKGVELSLSAAAIREKDFTWDISFNAALNRNRIIAIDRVSTSGILTGGIAGGVGNNVQILLVDEAVNAFYLFKHKLDANGNPLVDGVDHNDDGVTNLADMYEDTNGDGTVNDMDRRPFNQPAPVGIFGLTSNMNWKNFDLGFTFRASAGNWVYNNNASSAGFYNRLTLGSTYVNNLHTSVLETGFSNPQFFSDYYLENASFIRLDNITLGYTIKPRTKVNSVRAYITATNLFTLTRYTGLDPEVGGGIDNNPYPRARGIIFGVSLGL
jgi:TonB-dependent starch-binding outer membrane protein SusC